MLDRKWYLMLFAIALLLMAVPAMAQDSGDDRQTCDFLASEEGAEFVPDGLELDKLTEGECTYLLTHADDLPELLPSEFIGQRYMANDADGKPYVFDNDGRPAVLTYRWTLDGWFWPPALPVAAEREFFAVSYTAPAGSYSFNGVSCWLSVDEDRDGTIDPRDGDVTNKPDAVVGYGNDLTFTVATPHWGRIECDGGPSSGASLQWLGSELEEATEEAAADAEETEEDTEASEWPEDLFISVTQTNGGTLVASYPDSDWFVISESEITLTETALAEIAEENYTIWVVGDVDIEFSCGTQVWNTDAGAGWCPPRTDVDDVTFVVTLQD